MFFALLRRAPIAISMNNSNIYEAILKHYKCINRKKNRVYGIAYRSILSIEVRVVEYEPTNSICYGSTRLNILQNHFY